MCRLLVDQSVSALLPAPASWSCAVPMPRCLSLGLIRPFAPWLLRDSLVGWEQDSATGMLAVGPQWFGIRKKGKRGWAPSQAPPQFNCRYTEWQCYRSFDRGTLKRGLAIRMTGKRSRVDGRASS